MFRQRIEEFQMVFDTIPPLLQGKCWGQDGIHYSEVFLFTNTSNGRQLGALRGRPNVIMQPTRWPIVVTITASTATWVEG